MIKNTLARIVVFVARVLTEKDKQSSRPVPYGGRFYSHNEDYATKARLYYGDDQY